jgi:hypothetical protein
MDRRAVFEDEPVHAAGRRSREAAQHSADTLRLGLHPRLGGRIDHPRAAGLLGEDGRGSAGETRQAEQNGR